MEDATQVDGMYNYARRDQDYARAFRDYGVDIDELPVRDVDRPTQVFPAGPRGRSGGGDGQLGLEPGSEVPQADVARAGSGWWPLLVARASTPSRCGTGPSAGGLGPVRRQHAR